MNRLLPFIALTASTAMFMASAHAEIFRCEQADGTTVFSHVSCRVAPPAATMIGKAELANDQDHAEKSVAHNAKSNRKDVADTHQTIEDVESGIEELEIALGELRRARETEIANAPFSAADPTTLTQLKRDIRAAYQDEIDDRLSALLTLRERRSQLLTNLATSINAD